MIGLSSIGQYRLGNQLIFWVGLVMIPTLIAAAARGTGRFPAGAADSLAQMFPLLGELLTVLRARGRRHGALRSQTRRP